MPGSLRSPELRRLPLDSDAVARRRADRAHAIHLRPAFLLLVAAGGTVGTAAREAITLVVPPDDGFPVAIFAINVAGAFVLGLLLDSLAHRGPDEGPRRLVRLLVGTGFCGGFTTYSSLASATAVLLAHGSALQGAVYAVATLAVGGLAAWGGIVCGGRGRRRG